MPVGQQMKDRGSPVFVSPSPSSPLPLLISIRWSVLGQAKAVGLLKVFFFFFFFFFFYFFFELVQFHDI